MPASSSRVDDGANSADSASGDPACWAHRVCRECGRFAEQRLAEVCAVCGAELPSRDA